MHYDDRLATVLRLPTHGRSMARVQLAQLLDLLGMEPSEARGDLLDTGYLRVSALCHEFTGAQVAGMLAEPGLRLRSPRLVASLCHVGAAVARAALNAAHLEEAEWLDVIPALPPACWSMLWQRRDLPEGPRAMLARFGAAAIALPPATPAPRHGQVLTDSAPASSTATASTLAQSPLTAAPLPMAEAIVPPAAPAPATTTTPATAKIGDAPLPPTAEPEPAAVTAPPATPPPHDEPPLPSAAPTAFAPMPIWQHHPDDGIGAIVRRIEAFRRAREAAQREAGHGSMGQREAGQHDTAPLAQDAPRLPLGEAPTQPAPLAFDVETDCDGSIVQADDGVAAMVVGLELADLGTYEEVGNASQSRALAELIRYHQPIRALAVHLAGAPAIAGAWQLDATPHFDMPGGRFTGYLGRFRRLPAADAAPMEAPAATVTADSPADRLRQSLHELRTPVNAIQGFSEIIQQQLFGPTPHEYRALAAVIAADAARMLAGFEELERLARIDTGALELASGTSDLADCVTAAVVRLEHHAAARGIVLERDGFAGALPLELAGIETERLCWRLLATLVSATTAGERLSLRLSRDDQHACLSLSLPAALAALGSNDPGNGGSSRALFHASVQPPLGATGEGVPSAGMFGTGFALRLARAEARAAGGSLKVEGANLCLRLPGLTQNATGHSLAV